MNPKVMVIGLDGATLDILKPLMRSGELPVLDELRKQGVHGPLQSTLLPGTPQAWSTMVTGKNPGNHGIFEFVSRRPKTYDLFPLDASHRESLDIWEILSNAGKKVGVINVPFTYPPRAFSGSIGKWGRV